jgi:hypothetical protein
VEERERGEVNLVTVDLAVQAWMKEEGGAVMSCQELDSVFRGLV